MEIYVRRAVWLSSIPCFGIIYGGTIDCEHDGGACARSQPRASFEVHVFCSLGHFLLCYIILL